MSNPFHKDVREFINHAKASGFHCEGMTGSGHWRLRHTDGAILIVPATPAGKHWHKRLDSIMRKLIKGAQP